MESTARHARTGRTGKKAGINELFGSETKWRLNCLAVLSCEDPKGVGFSERKQRTQSFQSSVFLI
jgi:hypothetical protein